MSTSHAWSLVFCSLTVHRQITSLCHREEIRPHQQHIASLLPGWDLTSLDILSWCFCKTGQNRKVESPWPKEVETGSSPQPRWELDVICDNCFPLSAFFLSDAKSGLGLLSNLLTAAFQASHLCTGSSCTWAVKQGWETLGKSPHPHWTKPKGVLSAKASTF